VGLLFIDFQSPKRLRVHGRAHREPLSAIAAPWPEAQFAVLVDVERVFPNCPRYIHQRGLEGRSPFVPQAGVPTPVPAWKRMEWAVDVLPAGDPAATGGPP
jgi:hypothetical protein